MNGDDLLQPFRFRVEFFEPSAAGFAAGEPQPLCGGAFSEVSGLEATMEPKAIKEGGRNYGDRQRAGRVTFATVILKRGVTPVQHLWRWFELVAGGRYAIRLDARLVHLGPGEDPETGRGALEWRMANALPVKFRAATMNAASANEVAVEELHFVHEGLSLVQPGRGAGR